MYKIVLAIRYFLKKRISYLAFLAVALCVFIVVIVMTVMTGLLEEFKAKNHRFTGDCIVGTESLVGFPYYEEFEKILEQKDFVQAVSPVVKGYALVSPAGMEQNFGLEIMGVDAAKHSRTTNFGQTLYYRHDDPAKAFEPVYDSDLPGFVAGIDRWLIRDSNGQYFHDPEPRKSGLVITCVPLNAKGALAKAGAGIVNSKTFYFSDTSHSGLARLDYSTLYLPLEEAQQLCGMEGAQKRVNAIFIKFKPDVDLDIGCRQVSELWQDFVASQSGQSEAGLLNNVTVQSWKSYRRTFIAAMEKEHTMVIVMFVLVGVTTVFIVLVVFNMIISHKFKDIGILKSVGVSSGNIIQLFGFFAFMIGLLGAGVGALGGWLFLLKINRIEDWLFANFRFQLWDRTIYAIGAIPNHLEIGTLAVIIVSAIVACLAGAMVPAGLAARMKPVETLQVNQL